MTPTAFEARCWSWTDALYIETTCNQGCLTSGPQRSEKCIIGLFKTECINTGAFHLGPFKSIAHIEFATTAWVDWYNGRCLLIRCGDTVEQSLQDRSLPFRSRFFG